MQRNAIGIITSKQKKNGLKDFKQNRPAEKIKKQRSQNSEMAKTLSYAFHGFSDGFYFGCID